MKKGMVMIEKDGVFVVVQVGGRQIFTKSVPLPPEYEQGKMMIASLGADAMAQLGMYRAAMEIDRLRKELAESKKKVVVIKETTHDDILVVEDEDVEMDEVEEAEMDNGTDGKE